MASQENADLSIASPVQTLCKPLLLNCFSALLECLGINNKPYFFSLGQDSTTNTWA